MEDEDGESKVRDMWSILGDQQVKDTTFDKTLKQSIDNVYTDTIEDEKHIIRYNNLTTKDSPGKATSTGSKIVFKGFKKRILAQAQETQTINSRSSGHEQELTYSNVSPKNSKDKRGDGKRGKITEYAQYLGLQPSSKNKCSKCHSLANFCSTLNQNQCTCNSTMAPVQGLSSTSESSNFSHAANFKISRKVYLCAACGTYFENWNLFLHMRDIHKRHICLFCLGMFGQAERLSYHLSKKHSVPEMTFTSVEDFYRVFKGSCYLVCCTCEKVFSETDNFYNHFCSPPSKQEATASMCTLCRQTGTHASTCSLAVEASKDSQTTIPQTSGTPPYVSGKSLNASAKSTSRKSTKSNRSRHVEEDSLNSYQQRSSKKSSGKSSETTQLLETRLSSDVAANPDDAHSESENSAIRDTVSETIMEVSRYVGDSCSEEGEDREDKEEDKEDKSVSQELLSETKPPSEIDKQEVTDYDSITRTIMEVSSATSETKKDIVTNEETSTLQDDSTITETSTEETNDLTVDTSHERTESDELNSSQEYKDDSAPKETENAEVAADRKTDFDAGDSESSAHSPVARSLFSPQHESVVSEMQAKEASDDETVQRNESTSPEMPTATVSFNAVPSSDRSLVIKICTNRNAQFSVTTGVNNAAQSESLRESEENNNAEESTSDEKLPDTPDKEKDRTSNAESDSDSEKLAVVDGNIEETAEGEETGETEAEADVQTGINTELEAENNGETRTNLVETEEKVSEENISANLNEGDSNELRDVDYADGNPNASNVQSIVQPSDGIALAGEDVPVVDLNVEGTLDSMEIEDLLKRCIEAASPFCVYCNHARHIAVNGKQLGLHMLAEHKFQPQHPAIIIHSDQFTVRVKRSLEELESYFFNLNSYSSSNGTYNVPTVRTYECFHCRFHSAVHKELYLHNRKMHQKTILICIMCKSTFYSYSELLCHLCPGAYSPNINVKYRCCLCPVASLPSAFRLMVHLRKRHHACDVCLESTGNQQRLSNHVWKHKLHHLCYRCGIAYRNKPDITKHLFWKHGTESVLCKKCLQKKWPHIYHFCIPPTAFVCEECGSSFSRAVALKVHKRLHSGDQPYVCGECSERFISQKLLTRHEAVHKEPVNVEVNNTQADLSNHVPSMDEDKSRQDKDTIQDVTKPSSTETTRDSVKETVKKVVDVYDLPPLNLSSESDTDAEELEKKDDKIEKKEDTETEAMEKTETETVTVEESADTSAIDTTKEESTNRDEGTLQEETDHGTVEVEQNEEEKKQAEIMDGIWDNFKSYTASLEQQETQANTCQTSKETEAEKELEFIRTVVLADHDYCVVSTEKDGKDQDSDQIAAGQSGEGGANGSKDTSKNDFLNDYSKAQRSPSAGSVVLNVSGESDGKRKSKSPKKKKQNGSTSSSDSSSDSDSSSCSCGTNCSCSSSSSGSSSSSSSSSDSDSSASESSPRKSSNKKERKKDRESTSENKSTPVVDVEKQEEEAITTPVPVENGLEAEETPQAEPVCPSPQKTILRESDLETDETDTDEDFYDEHPQQLANKLLAEKRNQLLLLAAVAPASTVDSSISTVSLNNGITDTNDSFAVTPSPDPVASFPEVTAEVEPQAKRKVKTKKRKKGERGRQRNQQRGTVTTAAAPNTVESIKLNIPKAFYQKNAGYSMAGAASHVQPSSRSATPSFSTTSELLASSTNTVATSGVQRLDSLESHSDLINQSTNVGAATAASESESGKKRSSKRKRIPKRFYGDSSDEETEKQQQPAFKWRKVEPPPQPVVTLPTSARLSFGGKTLAYRTVEQRHTEHLQPAVATSATESDDVADSSSAGEFAGEQEDTNVGVIAADAVDAVESSDSEVEVETDRSLAIQQQTPNVQATATNQNVPERPINLYCYCQCPYDEVSEMIACDGDDCRIEWFHFECVGIMVPPKGKWYCPDCRKKHGIVQNNEDYFD